MVGDILARLEKLPDFPGIGAARDYVRPGLRMITRRKYVVYYVVGDKEIAVIRVLHGSRDVEAIVGGDAE